MAGDYRSRGPAVGAPRLPALWHTEAARCALPSAAANRFQSDTWEMTMKNLLAALCCLLLASAPAFAQDKSQPAKKEPTEAQKKQQQRMTDCNKMAGDKKLEGDARKSFMSSCLKGEDADKKTAQQQKMTDCNKQASAKGLKGDERQKFMSKCLSG
jgi:hypothetical protein